MWIQQRQVQPESGWNDGLLFTQVFDVEFQH
jgi:hypothetical protein